MCVEKLPHSNRRERIITSESITDGVIDQAFGQRTLGAQWEDDIGRLGERQAAEEGIGMRFEEHDVDGGQRRLGADRHAQLLVGVVHLYTVLRQVSVEFTPEPAFEVQCHVGQNRKHLRREDFVRIE